MYDAPEKLLIAPSRPKGVLAWSRLARLVAKLDRLTVRYRLRYGDARGGELAGWGRLCVEQADERLFCRVAGEAFRPSPVEYSFHSFWLTRRGMILLVLNLLEERTAQERSAQETFIQPTGQLARQLKTEAADWFKRVESRNKPGPAS